LSIYSAPRSGYGFIYILSNQSMPGLLKVGLTTNSVHQRVTELNTTGVPTKFKSERIFEIEERFLRQVEKAVHDTLKGNGAHHGKEFFRVDLETCVRCVEDLIHKFTGSVAPELVGQAVARQERDRKKWEWQLEEDRRVKTVLEERNTEVRLKRTQWIADETRRREISSGADQKSLWAKLTDGLATVIGLPLVLALLYVLLLLLSEFFGWFLIVTAGIVGAVWFYYSVKTDEARSQKDLQAQAGQRFPWVSEEEIPRRTMPSFDGGKAPEAVEGYQTKSVSDRDSEASKATRESGDQFNRTRNDVSDKTTNDVLNTSEQSVKRRMNEVAVMPELDSDDWIRNENSSMLLCLSSNEILRVSSSLGFSIFGEYFILYNKSKPSKLSIFKTRCDDEAFRGRFNSSTGSYN